MSHTDSNPSGVTPDQLTLYLSRWCGYCARVAYAVEELGLDLAVRDTAGDATAAQELLAGGGRRQVPCLRIDRPDGASDWLYESLDIVEYLRGHFA